MAVSTLVDQALRAAGIPIAGVATPNLSDRATWRVDFDPSATPAQRTQAATILQTVVVDATAETDYDAMSQTDQKILKAVTQGLWEAIPSPLLTKPQLRTRIIAIFKGL